MTSRASSLERSVGLVHSNNDSDWSKNISERCNHKSCGKKKNIEIYSLQVFYHLNRGKGWVARIVLYCYFCILSPGLYINILCESSFCGVIKLHRKRGLLLYLLFNYFFGWFKLLVSCSLGLFILTSKLRVISQKSFAKIIKCFNRTEQATKNLTTDWNFHMKKLKLGHRDYFLLLSMELCIGKTYLQLLNNESIS